MGTGANMSSAEKLAALATRRAELEALLAVKNEELYALCVQEVQLTGVVPPEAPLSPDAPAARERRASVRSSAASDGDSESAGAAAAAGRRREHKNLAHRLSTPSISGASTKSGVVRTRRPDAGRNDGFPTPQETFSIPTSQTYPSLAPRREPASQAPPVVYRHHTLTADYMNKIYYGSAVPEPQNVSRLRETHFSSSHPDIAMHYNHGASAPQPPPQNDSRATPLLYQYASQLKAQSQHLSGLSHNHAQSKRRSEVGRRSTLQRTQTYHLTSHSDYTGHLDAASGSAHHSASSLQQRPHADVQTERDYFPHIYVPMEKSPSVPHVMHPRERNILRSTMQLTLQPEGDQRYRSAVSPLSQVSGYSQGNADTASIYKYSPHGEKVKEKQWYETSLDSPAVSPRADPPLPKKNTNVKRTPSLGASQTYELMSHQPAALSPGQCSQTSLASPRSDVTLESPKNCTVVEQGRCIPYREVTKPFEMSDFYKYSTKFRQANQKTNANTLPSPGATSGYRKSPMELPQYPAPEHWHGQNH